MVMSETLSEKRKFGKAGESSVNKKARREVSKKYGKFTEDCIPDGVFPIGDDVFVFASTYYDSASVHIRRFKKYGKTYYPTPEGITLDPRWIEYIMRKKKVPESLEELPSGLFPPERHIQITSENFTLILLSSALKGCGSPVVKVSNHGRHVMSSIPVPLKTRRVGQRCTLNLSRAETSSRWCGVVVRRGGVPAQVSSTSLTMVQNYVVRRQKPSCG
ncbi:uncharacterized protein TNCV_4860511 [Trichonephila clavipes]|nr:uncharacterized protein TNCV_4860511 [Trichonephila clavipes]